MTSASFNYPSPALTTLELYCQIGNGFQVYHFLKDNPYKLNRNICESVLNSINKVEDKHSTLWKYFADVIDRNGLKEKIRHAFNAANIPQKSLRINKGHVYAVLSLDVLRMEICQFLSPRELAIAGRTNTYFHHISLGEMLNCWKRKSKDRLDLSSIKAFQKAFRTTFSYDLFQIFPNHQLKKLDLRSQSGFDIEESGIIQEIIRRLPYLGNLTELRFNKAMDHASLAMFGRDCPQLKYVQLRCSHNEEIVAIASRCKHLVQLRVDGTNSITDEALLSVADNCKELEFLTFTKSAITDESVCLLADRCQNLRLINLDGCAKISDISILELAKKCKKMTNIICRNCPKVSPKVLAGISTLLGYSTIGLEKRDDPIAASDRFHRECSYKAKTREGLFYQTALKKHEWAAVEYVYKTITKKVNSLSQTDHILFRFAFQTLSEKTIVDAEQWNDKTSFGDYNIAIAADALRIIQARQVLRTQFQLKVISLTK